MFGISHHLSLRRRFYKNLEPLPHPEFKKRLFDQFVFWVAFFGPFFTLPQVWEIYSQANASSVSAFSWFAYFLFSIIWLIYGLVHKERPIILANFLGLIFNGLVVIGVILY